MTNWSRLACMEKTMPANESEMAKTHRTVWAGRVLTGLVVAFLLLDGVMKLIPAAPVIETSAQMGWPTEVAGLRMLGGALLLSTLLYVIPRTSLLGAVLLTGYLGGTVAIHVRIADPWFSHILFGGLYRNHAVGWAVSSRQKASRALSCQAHRKMVTRSPQDSAIGQGQLLFRETLSRTTVLRNMACETCIEPVRKQNL